MIITTITLIMVKVALIFELIKYKMMLYASCGKEAVYSQKSF